MPSKSFVFHEEWKEALNCLPPQVRLEVYDAIIEYGLSGTLVELKAIAGVSFNIIKNGIDNDRHRAESIRKKRSEAGKKHKGNQHTLKIGTNGTSVPTEWNKCPKEPLNSDVSEDLKIGTSVPTAEKHQLKEAPLFPPDEENNPITLKEVNPPISPQEKPHVIRARIFVKPSINDINEYIRKMGYAFTAEAFFDFYESKGWMIGKNKMKDWKAACRTWSRKREDYGNNRRNSNDGATQRAKGVFDIIQRLAAEDDARREAAVT